MIEVTALGRYFTLELNDTETGTSGLLRVKREGDCWLIRDIEAHPKGNGVGTRLLVYCLELADRQGAAVRLNVASDTEEDTARVKRWYTSHGFVSTHGAEMIRPAKVGVKP